jgi:hypothetical protein
MTTEKKLALLITLAFALVVIGASVGGSSGRAYERGWNDAIKRGAVSQSVYERGVREGQRSSEEQVKYLTNYIAGTRR